MAKANSSFSEVQIARRIKEGRGVDAAVARLLGARVAAAIDPGSDAIGITTTLIDQPSESE